MKTLKEIIAELGIDVPVMASEIKGNKMILQLYGGRTVEYKLSDNLAKDESTATPATRRARKVMKEEELRGLKLDELRKIASEQGIKVHGKGKTKLIYELCEVK